MKKHQLTAMVLSALSAGILISCSKPNEAENATQNEKEVKTAPSIKDSSASTTTDKTANIEPIELSAATSKNYLNQVANKQIVKAYNDVFEQSRAFNDLAIKHCQYANTINGDALVTLRKQWLALAQSWAYAELINFGPAMDSMSNLYINYYPDERGMVHQGVIDLIEGNPNLTAAELASESAIVQGIPGLEEVLYANESLTPAQCNYIVSASDALTNRLSEVQQAWQDSPAQLLGIDDNANKLGLNRWINSILALVETTKSNSLDQPLGLTGNKKGHLPAAAAKQSKAIITAKVSALNTALTDPSLIALLSENGYDTLADNMSTILSDTSTILAQMPDNIAQAEPEKQQQVYKNLTELTQLIKRQLMPVLGVQVGFNSTDGD